MPGHNTNGDNRLEDHKGRPSQIIASHGSDVRMRAAAQRAMAAYQAVTRKAERLSEEMDEVTPAHGIVTAELGPDDSVVTSIAAVIDSHQHKKTG